METVDSNEIIQTGSHEKYRGRIKPASTVQDIRYVHPSQRLNAITENGKSKDKKKVRYKKVTKRERQKEKPGKEKPRKIKDKNMTKNKNSHRCE